MLGIFRKSKLHTSLFPRNDRTEIEGEVYIKRLGKPTLRGTRGNICAGGLFVKIFNNDLEKGGKVEIILATQIGSIKRISRMMGIVIRTDESGAALVTYKKEDLKTTQEVHQAEMMLKQELGEV